MGYGIRKYYMSTIYGTTAYDGSSVDEVEDNLPVGEMWSLHWSGKKVDIWVAGKQVRLFLSSVINRSWVRKDGSTYPSFVAYLSVLSTWNRTGKPDGSVDRMIRDAYRRYAESEEGRQVLSRRLRY